VQGYNVQATVTAEQIVIAAEVTVDSPDFGHLQPMIAATERELSAIGVANALPGVVLADAGTGITFRWTRSPRGGCRC